DRRDEARSGGARVGAEGVPEVEPAAEEQRDGRDAGDEQVLRQLAIGSPQPPQGGDDQPAGPNPFVVEHPVPAAADVRLVQPARPPPALAQAVEHAVAPAGTAWGTPTRVPETSHVQRPWLLKVTSDIGGAHNARLAKQHAPVVPAPNPTPIPRREEPPGPPGRYDQPPVEAFTDLSPVLEGRLVVLEPLRAEHEDGLRAAAADDRVWRYMRVVASDPGAFHTWFGEAMSAAAAGAEGPFCIVRRGDGAVVGSSHYLALRPEDRVLEI